MALTPEQLKLINNALIALDIKPTKNLLADVNGGLVQLSKLLGKEHPFKFDPAKGYDETIGQDLLQRVQQFESSKSFKSIKGAHAMGIPTASLFPDNTPQAIKDDPQKLFDLFKNAPALVAALDQAKADGKLTVKSAAPATGSTNKAQPQVTVTKPEPAPKEQKPMDAKTASYVAELGLRELVPVLNGALQKSQNNILVQLFAADLVQKRIPGITGKPDGVMDLNEQAALQGLMMVLGDNRVLGLNGKNAEQPYLYTPEKGALLLKRLKDPKNPPQFLSMLDEEQQQKLKETLESGQLDTLVKALDVLSKPGKDGKPYLAGYPIFYGQGLDYAPLTQKILNTDVERLGDTTKGGGLNAQRLLDTMLLHYTGTEGINSILNEKDHVDLKIDPKLNPDARLQEFYKKAREEFVKDGRTHDDFVMFLSDSLDVMNVMPFGSDEQRDAFKAGVIDALKNSKDDPNAFFKGFKDTMKTVLKDGQSVHYTFETHIRPNPTLKNFEALDSNGAQFSAKDIQQAYHGAHLIKDHLYNVSFDRPLPRSSHIPFTFKDDKGDLYVAGIDQRSNTFNIEKVDVDAITSALFSTPTKSVNEWIERQEDLKQQNLAFSMLSSQYTSSDDLTVDLLIAQGKDPEDYGITGFQRTETSFQPLSALIAKHKAEIEQFKARPKSPEQTQEDTPKNETLKENFNGKSNTPTMMLDTEQGQRLSDEAYKMRTAPRILSQDQLNFLKDFDGQTKLQVGSFQGSSIRIKGVDIQAGDAKGPLMGYFDQKANMIRVIPVPAEMLDPHKRDAIMADVHMRHGDTRLGYYNHIQHRFPELTTAMNYTQDARNISHKDLQPIPAHFERTISHMFKQLDKAGYGPKGSLTSKTQFYKAAEQPPTEEAENDSALSKTFKKVKSFRDDMRKTPFGRNVIHTGNPFNKLFKPLHDMTKQDTSPKTQEQEPAQEPKENSKAPDDDTLKQPDTHKTHDTGHHSGFNPFLNR